LPNNFGINQNKFCMKKVNPERESRQLGTFMNFLTDFAFKKILGNSKLLIDFLNEIVGEECKVVSLDYLKLEQLGRTDKDRKAVYDIYCKNERDEYFIIEMQVGYQKHYIDRVLFYSTFPIQSYALKGKWNFQLKSLYCISILDFELFDDDFYLGHLDITKSETQKKATDKLNIIIIELPKFKKTLGQLKTRADGWLYCLKHLGTLKEQPVELKDPVFDKLFELARINKLDEDDMEQYRKSVTEYEDVQVCMADTLELGIERGMKEGMKKGILKTAKNGLKEGLSMDILSRITGLTPEQIIQIR